jgi:ABC-type Na+ efflux pump permease subunit
VNGRVRAVLGKELREFRRNKLVIGTMVALPVLFLIIPIASLLAIGADTPVSTVRSVVSGQLLTQFFIPLILPTIIAGYAILGEREQGTLEPVLTTPIRHEELLLGKALAAVIPTVAVAYAMLVVFVLVILGAAAPVVVHLVWKPAPFVAFLLFDPLLAAFSIWIGLAVSARSSDVRVAQQLSAFAVLPMFGFVALVTFGVVRLGVPIAVGVAAVLAVIDAGAWRVVSRIFDRERLLAGPRPRQAPRLQT